MNQEHNVATSAVTYGDRVRPGDAVYGNGRFRVVTNVRRAQGRKPKAGENLHLLTEDEVIKVNSLDPVRIIRGR